MKKRETAIRYLSKHIDKIIIMLGYCALLSLLLGLTPGVLYQQRWQEVQQISNDYFVVRYTMNSGDNKPAILSSTGEELLAVTGWESTIGTDDSHRSLWDHTLRIEAPKPEGQMITTMRWENYELMQTMELRDDKMTFEYKFSSDNSTRLALCLKHRYQRYSTLIFENTVINEDLENIENRAAGLKYRVELELGAAENVRWSIDNVPYWLSLTLCIDNISAKTLKRPVAKLTLRYTPLEKHAEQK